MKVTVPEYAAIIQIIVTDDDKFFDLLPFVEKCQHFKKFSLKQKIWLTNFWYSKVVANIFMKAFESVALDYSH